MKERRGRNKEMYGERNKQGKINRKEERQTNRQCKKYDS
jgi:hypothetical protein